MKETQNHVHKTLPSISLLYSRIERRAAEGERRYREAAYPPHSLDRYLHRVLQVGSIGFTMFNLKPLADRPLYWYSHVLHTVSRQRSFSIFVQDYRSITCRIALTKFICAGNFTGIESSVGIQNNFRNCFTKIVSWKYAMYFCALNAQNVPGNHHQCGWTLAERLWK